MKPIRGENMAEQMPKSEFRQEYEKALRECQENIQSAVSDYQKNLQDVLKDLRDSVVLLDFEQ
ncbi:MAG: hypothetical protein KDD52_09230 [Bdellovibrionales bacterium]|nr:hypothetical protein [Bdellovibrionales bacterium]